LINGIEIEINQIEKSKITLSYIGAHLLIIISWLVESVYLHPKMIPLSSFPHITQNNIVTKIQFVLQFYKKKKITLVEQKLHYHVKNLNLNLIGKIGLIF
jgi:hypothetical protein